MEQQIEKLKELLLIDEHDLDTECVKQPSIFFYVQEEYEKEVSIRDELKKEVTKIWSEEFLNAKRSGKVSDVVAKAIADSSENYDRIYQQYLDSKHRAAIWGALKEAFQQRVPMLRDICNLYISGYYTDVSVKESRKIVDFKTIKKQLMEDNNG